MTLNKNYFYLMKQTHLTVTKILIARGHDENSAAIGRSQVHVWSRPKDTWNSGGVHPFSEGPKWTGIQEANHVIKDSTPITVFLLFFTKVIQLLVAETNKYYSQY
jgi:hypothetical protein